MRRHAGRGVDFEQRKAAVIAQHHVDTAPGVGADGQSGFLNRGLDLFGYVLGTSAGQTYTVSSE